MYYIENEDWSSVFNASVEEKFDKFYSIFMFNFNLAFPKVLIRNNKSRHNWINKELKNEKNNLIQLQKLVKKTASPNMGKKLQSKRRQYRKLLTKTKKDFIENKMKNSNN